MGSNPILGQAPLDFSLFNYLIVKEMSKNRNLNVINILDMNGYKHGDILRGPQHRPVVLDTFGAKTIQVLTLDKQHIIYDLNGYTKESDERLEPMNGTWENFLHDDSNFVGLEDIAQDSNLLRRW